MRAGLVAAGATLLGGCLGGMFGGGADPREFTSVDKDKDSTVTREEFTKWGEAGGLLASFMGKGEKTIAEPALAQGLYQLWNIEGSDLTEAEWNEGMQTWFPDAAKTETFASWDLDQNGMIDEEEMTAGLAHADLLKQFDENGNGQIGASELLSRFYQVFDTNKDERLSMDEWTSGLGRWNWPV